MLNKIFQKIVSFMRQVENNGSARQAIDYNKILHMRFACRINKDRTEFCSENC